MDHRLVLFLLSLATVSLAGPASSSWNNDNRYRGYDYDEGRYDEASRGRETKRDDYAAQPGNGGTHTYQSRQMCEELCLTPCGMTTVYLGDESLPMYTCDKLKPPKQASPFFQTLKGNSFYMTLSVLGVIVVLVLVIITCCFCCSYCCKNPSSAESSRGSSKQALAHNEDGEFKEYLNGNGLSNGHHHDDIGAMKREREREFTRRPRPAPQIV